MGIAPQVKTETVYTTRTTCRSCDSKNLTGILDLGNQILPRFVKGGPEGLPQAPLHLCRCASCGLLQLEHTVNPDLLFREFWYRSGINQTMRNALCDVVETALQYHGKGAWLDIGANDGYLLSRVPSSFRKVAVEPALNFKADLEEHADRVVSDYFTADSDTYEVITSVAMFYDLDDPMPFLHDISKSLAPGGVWVNQLNDAPTMLRANAFDAICHEHLCYYDIPVLKRMYGEAGLTITRVMFNDVNGGSIRVVAKKSGPGVIGDDLFGLPGVEQQEAHEFANRTKRWKNVMMELIGNLAMHGELWGYGASTKGAVLLQYLDAGTSIAKIADRNPQKKGLKLVGTWPITDEVEFRTRKPRYALVLPWAFKEEFDTREESVRKHGTAFLYPLPEITFVP